MSQLTPITTEFLFNTSNIRTATDEQGNPWFCAKDVCGVLDIAWRGQDTLENMPEEWQGVRSFRTPSAENGRGGGEQELIFINEAGLYFLTVRSNKPNAKPFINWLCSEVIPAIRKYGSFGDVSHKERLAYSKQIIDIQKRMEATLKPETFKFLADEMRELCQLANKPMPNLRFIGMDYKQLDMFIDNQGGAA